MALESAFRAEYQRGRADAAMQCFVAYLKYVSRDADLTPDEEAALAKRVLIDEPKALMDAPKPQAGVR